MGSGDTPMAIYFATSSNVCDFASDVCIPSEKLLT